MKTIILAGGWGSRLGQLAEVIPKPMVQIGNRPILWHIMKMYSTQHFNEFIICLGVKGEVVKQYFYQFEALNSDFTINLSDNSIEYHSNHHEMDWKVTLVDTGLNTLKGGRIKRVERYLDDRINMVTYGDGIANINLKELLSFHKSHGRVLTITGVQPTSRFGELEEDKSVVKSFVEKPKSSKGYINGGFMVFNMELLEYLTTSETCDFEYGPLEKLAKERQVMVYKHSGEWDCMDHERDVVYLNNLWNDNKAHWKNW